MASITLRGNPINTSGELPPVGSVAPAFTLVDKDLSDVASSAFAGKQLVLSIVPSLDTPVCATSTQKFNEQASQLDNTEILVISADLPFAQGRFCEATNTDKVTVLSLMRGSAFAHDYGVLIVDGPLAGVTARAIVVIGSDGLVKHTELVPEIAQEPDYQAALNALA